MTEFKKISSHFLRKVSNSTIMKILGLADKGDQGGNQKSITRTFLFDLFGNNQQSDEIINL